jgi:hypothetical protein
MTTGVRVGPPALGSGRVGQRFGPELSDERRNLGTLRQSYPGGNAQ